MIDSGIFQMKTAAQLLAKLLKDYQRVQQNPTDSGLWFNLIVTADHLPEWVCEANESKARAMRDSHSLLRVCHHLSRNAKHFKARELRPNAGVVRLSPVSATNESRVDPLYATNVSTPRISAPLEFYLELSPTEASELGKTEMSALEFARLLVEFWETHVRSDG